ncbi:hypothetical protein K501DRAFT_268326 [Backusella circina FSU 941]|nr:hypothetical protein K501DRAFT_268326 [Backusella circina FSU 941]
MYLSFHLFHRAICKYHIKFFLLHSYKNLGRQYKTVTHMYLIAILVIFINRKGIHQSQDGVIIPLSKYLYKREEILWSCAQIRGIPLSIYSTWPYSGRINDVLFSAKDHKTAPLPPLFFRKNTCLLPISKCEETSQNSKNGVTLDFAFLIYFERSNVELALVLLQFSYKTELIFLLYYCYFLWKIGVGIWKQL